MSTEAAPPKRRLTPKRILLALFLLLLAASHVKRWPLREPGPGPSDLTVAVAAVEGDRRLEAAVRIAYREYGEDLGIRPPAILLHGSPGDKSQMAGVARLLGESRRVILPDLPGFGGSQRSVPDYSVRAHADYVLQLMDRLDVDAAHVVGFSMGGGVALDLYDLAPRRVRSIVLLAAIGVQELELFGDYELNHATHGAQLGLVWAVQEGLPHFGLFDGMLDVSYARNFYDTDQRPLRGILERFEPPMLVLHGRHDFLVPPEAAIEHHRIVPHSELLMLEDDHFMVFRNPDRAATLVEEFLERVDTGAAPSRDRAAPERLAAAALPYDAATAPPFAGFALVLAVLSIAAATLVSEDLTCIAVGLLVAQGRIEFVPGLVGCLVGIFVGDILLFLAGRSIGRTALQRRPLRWFISDDQVELASRWFAIRGPFVIVLSRFLPGARTATYFAAGTLHTSFLAFTFYFAFAVSLWTPLLIWASAEFGEEAFGWTRWLHEHPFLALLVIGLWILIVVRLVVPLFTWRGRRRLAAKLRRVVRWEFWPPWLFYPPVVVWVLWLGLRHRGLLVFTAANPAIPAGGFVAESKLEILEGLGAGPFVARTALLSAEDPLEARVEMALGFMRAEGLAFPVVLKPDAGQRGSGVVVAHDRAAVEAYLAEAAFDALVQEHVPGVEYGLFYVRRPGEAKGRIFSVTEKRMPEVLGDGERTVERLVLDDRRAACMASHYLALQDDPFRVPAAGERVTLVELGTHCRGAIFLDGRGVLTPELEARVEAISRGYDGFYFGRYDVRAPSADALRRGEAFKVLELNGVTSEATHIYDPGIGLFSAWSTLFEQWSVAFEIGADNRARGVRPASFGELIELSRVYRRSSLYHPAQES